MAARGQVDTGESITGERYTWDGVMWQVVIHMVFIFSAIALAWIDKISRSDDHRMPSVAGHQAHASAVQPEQFGHPHAIGQETLHTAAPERERA